MEWDQKSAQRWLSEAAPALAEAGLAASVVGSVARRGGSDNDLDLALAPAGAGAPRALGEAIEAIEWEALPGLGLRGPLEPLPAKHERWHLGLDLTDGRLVELWLEEARFPVVEVAPADAVARLVARRRFQAQERLAASEGGCGDFAWALAGVIRERWPEAYGGLELVLGIDNAETLEDIEFGDPDIVHAALAFRGDDRIIDAEGARPVAEVFGDEAAYGGVDAIVRAPIAGDEVRLDRILRNNTPGSVVDCPARLRGPAPASLRPRRDRDDGSLQP